MNNKNTGKNSFVHLDGPVFTNGKPHYGHIMISSIKDAYYRFNKLLGKDVITKPGWDCHGFPVENEVEKQFNLTSKQDIKLFGEDKFSNECRLSVFKYKSLWEDVLKQLNRDLNYEDYYATVTDEYMESVWWAFKECYNKNLVYRTRKPTLFSTKLESVVSNFEAQQNYRETTETSVYVKFKVKDFYFLVWTTTPWTLPANQGIAVNKSTRYSFCQVGNDVFVVASNLLEKLNLVGFKEVTGEYFVGMEYETIFDTYKKSGFVIHADYVTDSSGTGIVHLAPGFGEDDYNSLKEDPVIHIHPNGTFKEELNITGSVYSSNILDILKNKEVLFKEESITHNIPYCWRTDIPLIRYPVESWCLKVSEYKDKLLEQNQTVNWVPSHIKDGRFGNWLEDVKDWNLSRDRIWGCQIPIWENEAGDIMVFGSFEELNKYVNVSDYHKPGIDKAVFFHPERPQEDKYLMKPVKYVFDCWFESGCAPFAQFHYPFKQEEFNDAFPADFIVEGIDQTRGWFYSLIVVSTILFGQVPYKNVVVTGHINDEFGHKLSKKNKNYVPVKDILDKYNSDVVRMYFYDSSIYNGEGLKFNLKDLDNTQYKFFTPVENILKYKDTYSTIEEEDNQFIDELSVKYAEYLAYSFRTEFESYHVKPAIDNLDKLISFISTFYIKNNRSRFVNGSSGVINALDQMTKLLAFCLKPLAPNLTKNLDFQIPEKQEDSLDKINEIQTLIDLNMKIRSKNKIPSNKIVYGAYVDGLKHLSNKEFDQVMLFLGAKNKVVHNTKTKIKPNYKTIGKDFSNNAQDIFKSIKQDNYLIDGDNIVVNDIVLNSDYFVKEVIADNLSDTYNGLFLKLDNTYLEELEQDYLFKQFNKALSSFRKSNNFNIKDVINVKVKCPSDYKLFFGKVRNTNLDFVEESKEVEFYI